MVKIEFRKIIGFGNGGHVISLPKNWINQNKLKKGDLLEMAQGSGQLTFSIEKKEQEKEDNRYNEPDGWYNYNERDTYGQYRGSYAQDVEGLSDNFINDVLGGEPDAYWNID